jgi:hypothetical protein
VLPSLSTTSCTTARSGIDRASPQPFTMTSGPISADTTGALGYLARATLPARLRPHRAGPLGTRHSVGKRSPPLVGERTQPPCPVSAPTGHHGRGLWPGRAILEAWSPGASATALDGAWCLGRSRSRQRATSRASRRTCWPPWRKSTGRS